MFNFIHEKNPKISKFAHLNLWVIALCVSVVAWFFARSEQVTETSVMVPVKLRGVPEHMEVRVQPDVLRTSVRYPISIVGAVNADNMLFDVNIIGMFPDPEVEWSRKTIVLDQSNLVSNIPQAKDVQLSSQGRNPLSVTVEARWQAWPADSVLMVSGEAQLAERGLVLGKDLRVQPKQLWIIGDQDKLDQLKRDPITQRYQVPSAPIDLRYYTESSMETVRFDLPPGVDIVKPKSKTGEISINIQEITTERDLTTVPLTRQMFASDTVDADIATSHVSVKLRGPEALLKKIDPSAIQILPLRPPAELPDTTREVKLDAVFNSDVSAELGTRVTIMGVDPPSVNVRYSRKKQ